MKYVKKSCLLLLLLILGTSTFAENEQYAVFMEPVTDLFGEKLSEHGTENSKKNHKKEYVATIAGLSKYGCMRISQGLFNEVVKVIEYDKETQEIQVECTNMIWQHEPLKLWTERKNLKFITAVERGNFPAAVEHDNLDSLYAKNTIVLILPWTDRITNKTYSSGTRFLYDAKKSINKSFLVRFFSFKKNNFVTRLIPKKLARICSEKISPNKRVLLFLDHLKYLSKIHRNKIIPYVWGGRSFTGKIVDKGYEIKTGKFFDIDIEYWERGNIKKTPYTGYDCSSLILSVAQIFGIPYFYKTTTEALNYAPATKNSSLRDGDVVTYKGHIFVISDAKNSKMIDAKGYQNEFGRMRNVDMTNFFVTYKNELVDSKKLFSLHKKKHGFKIFKKSGILEKELSSAKGFSQSFFKIIDLRSMFTFMQKDQ